MSTKKGVVTAVDIERSSCRVLTDNMQFLSDVTWKGSAGGTSGYGDSNTPQEMDQVYDVDDEAVRDGDRLEKRRFAGAVLADEERDAA